MITASSVRFVYEFPPLSLTVLKWRITNGN
jgi:hypothetical protein